jgi:hypothetical protein
MHATTERPSRLAKLTTAAKECGLPYTTLRDLHFRGALAVVKVGRAWYVDRRDLDRAIDAMTVRETR